MTQIRLLEEELSERLYDLYWHQGLTFREVGAAMGMPCSTIQLRFTQLGIRARSCSEARKLSSARGRRDHIRTGPKPLHADRDRAAVYMKAGGASFAYVGSYFGVSRQRIHQIVGRHKYRQRQTDRGSLRVLYSREG